MRDGRSRSGPADPPARAPRLRRGRGLGGAGRRTLRGRRRRGAAGVGARTLPPPPRDQRGGRCRRDGAGRHGVAAEPRRARLHAGHRPAPARDLRAVREGPRALRDRRGVRVPGDRHRLGDGHRARSEPDVQQRRPATALLRGPQGGAAEAEARDAGRLDRGPPPGAVAQPEEHREGRAGPRPRRHREAQPGRGLDAGSRLGVRARARGPVSPAVRPGLHVDRMRARARERSPAESPSAPAAGGGSRRPTRSAGSTARSSSGLGVGPERAAASEQDREREGAA